jgi:hypothetical protein
MARVRPSFGVACRSTRTVVVLAVTAALIGGVLSLPGYAVSALTYGLTSDLGIQASPGVNVAGAINAAIVQLSSVAATSQSPVTLMLEGTYRIDTPVVLAGVRNLSIVAGPSGGGFQRFVQNTKPQNWGAKVPWYTYLDITESANILVDGIVIRGPLTTAVYNSALEQSAGVLIQGASNNVTVRNVTVTGVHGDFLMVAEHRQQRPTGILVENMVGAVAGRQMVADVGGNGLTIRRSTFRYSGRSGVDIEPSNPLGSANLTIEDSLFEGQRFYALAGGNERPHTNIVVRRSQFSGGLGLIKFGPPVGYPLGSHRGLVLEDVSYQWLPPRAGTINIARTLDVTFTRVTAVLRGPAGSIAGTGTVRDSRFSSVTILPPAPVVNVCGLTVVNTVGAGGCAQPNVAR